MSTMICEDLSIRTLTREELALAAGGHPFEESFADAALYRAGVSFVNCVFGRDEYYVGSRRIDKELARTLRSESTVLWKEKYADSANLVDFMREWKQVLNDKYSISWDGRLGTHSCHFS